MFITCTTHSSCTKIRRRHFVDVWASFPRKSTRGYYITEQRRIVAGSDMRRRQKMQSQPLAVDLQMHISRTATIECDNRISLKRMLRIIERQVTSMTRRRGCCRDRPSRYWNRWTFWKYDAGSSVSRSGCTYMKLQLLNLARPSVMEDWLERNCVKVLLVGPRGLETGRRVQGSEWSKKAHEWIKRRDKEGKETKDDRVKEC